MIAKWDTRMYRTISKNQQVVIGAIPNQQITEYEWLLQKVEQAETHRYQIRYRKFWGMQGVNSAFYSAYFSALKAARAKLPSLSALCQRLHPFSTRNTKQNTLTTLQFSFISKLRHSINPHLPIFDSRVTRLYLFREPSISLPLRVRIQGLVLFQRFLAREYGREKNGILAPIIAAFRHKFEPQHHTDTKIIDWLIWAFVELADNGKITW